MYLLWVVQDSLNLQKKVTDGDRHKEERSEERRVGKEC